VDGSVNAFVLANSSRNALKVMDTNSYVDADEMSFDYLKSVRSMYTSINWTTSNASTTSLYSHTIGPQTMWSPYTTPAHTGHTMSCELGPVFCYLSPHFQLWRGGIEVTFKFVKTQFHTGRLQITWTPNYNNITAPNLTTGLLALREIIDLRYTDEITLCLPYLVEYNYLKIGEPSGTLDVVVLNELRCPETCSSSLEILMFANGASDLEFAAPGSINPVSGGNRLPLPMWPQMGGTMENSAIGDCCQYPLTANPAMESVGEQFRSIKQFLNKSSYLPYGGSPTLWDNGVLLWPWFTSLASLSTGGTIQAPDPFGDIYFWLAPMYAFYRGGVDIHVSAVNNVSSGSTALVSAPSTLNIGASMFFNYGVLGPSSAAISAPIDVTSTNASSNGVTSWPTGIGFTSTNSAGLATFEVPWQSKTKCSLVVPSLANYVIPNDSSQSPVALNLLWSGCNNANANQPKLYRSFRDDFQLSYFIGVPPLAVTYT